MLLIGSRALQLNGVDIERKPRDYDYICTYDEYVDFVKENNPPVAYPEDGSHMYANSRTDEFMSSRLHGLNPAQKLF
jgi:hypothetical protein